MAKLPYRIAEKDKEVGNRLDTNYGYAGLTLAAVTAYYITKSKLTVVEQVCETRITGPLAPAVHHAASTYSDADIILVKSDIAGCQVAKVVAHVENMSNDYVLKDSGGNPVDGVVDVTDPDIQAFASAYLDGDGLGGYSALSGTYIHSH